MLQSRLARTAVRLSHSLQVPELHAPYTPFSAGVPVDQVRALSDYEQKWTYWTTSPAHYSVVPKTFGLVLVPEGQVWIVERAGAFSRYTHTHTHTPLHLFLFNSLYC